MARVGADGGGRKRIVGVKRGDTTRASFSLPGHAPPPKKNGRLEIEGMDTVVRAALNRAAAAATVAYQGHYYTWYQRIIAEWPVLTGFSKKALQITADQEGPWLAMRIKNLAPYSLYIRQKGYTTPNAVKRLIWDPSKQVTLEMARAIAEYVGD